MNSKLNFKQSLKRIIKEVIEEKKTDSEKSWAEMMDKLQNEIKKPVKLGDDGNYSVCDCEPHHISIRPIVHDIFDLQYFKDGTDRKKVLYVKYEEVKKIVKDWLNSKDENYVDSVYQRNVDNSKDKEGGKKSDKAAEENVVDPEKNNKPAKEIKAEKMNDEEDDPTQPMKEVGKFEKLVDYKVKKPNYKPPTLPEKLQKLVVKYTKRGKTRKK